MLDLYELDCYYRCEYQHKLRYVDGVYLEPGQRTLRNRALYRVFRADMLERMRSGEGMVYRDLADLFLTTFDSDKGLRDEGTRILHEYRSRLRGFVPVAVGEVVNGVEVPVIGVEGVVEVVVRERKGSQGHNFIFTERLVVSGQNRLQVHLFTPRGDYDYQEHEYTDGYLTWWSENVFKPVRDGVVGDCARIPRYGVMCPGCNYLSHCWGKNG